MAGAPTFRNDIAPILFSQCVGCHRPGQSAPFSLTTYTEARAKAKLIREVTETRIMPPWLPDPKKNHFVGERFLTAEQIQVIGQWVADGSPEGTEGTIPPLPELTSEWSLGKPDLVVSLPEAYLLPPDGIDVYRNFVIPIPLAARQWIDAYEFRPGSAKNVHHAFLRFDKTTGSRDADERESGLG
ncbi:MAG: Copper type ascorbate-dependent monooxygenase, C-terminal domain protein, partial [Verrucomicrobiales bacterium]|nr:Copper type ascorbate-dependent monooxygenase, C-terminal domain protein [Verrucomicrobiales bacterium]